MLVLGPNKNIDFDEKVQRLVDMGTQCDNARKILAIVDWSLEAAILIVSKNLAWNYCKDLNFKYVLFIQIYYTEHFQMIKIFQLWIF